MCDYILSILFVFTSITISFICYKFHAWDIYEICFIVLGFIFTILLRRQSKKRNAITVCIIIFIKPFLVLADQLYDGMSLLMGVPVDILFTGIGLLIGFIISKLFIFIFEKIKNKIIK